MNRTLEDIQRILNESTYIADAGEEGYSHGMIEDDMDQFFCEFNYDNASVRFCWDDEDSGTLNVYGKADDETEWGSIKIVFPHLQNNRIVNLKDFKQEVD